MAKRLEGKTALITGGTSGIGAATAELFISEGANVVISGRSVKKGETLIERLGNQATYCESDVTNEEDIAKAVNFTLDKHESIDIFII